jgi:hypothetical protein
MTDLKRIFLIVIAVLGAAVAWVGLVMFVFMR